VEDILDALSIIGILTIIALVYQFIIEGEEND
jgi:hypothetical protein